MIRTRDLVKRYGERTVVDHLDLEVASGEVFGLLGPNGAGKTTTILMLLGLSEPTGGRLEVAGLDPAREPLQVKRRVGYLPDNVGFYPAMTGRQNLRYTARLNQLEGDDAERRITHVLDRVGLAEAGDRPAGQYSRGMRQRLGIADALVKDPDVLILDEPTIAIDPAGVAEILRLIRDLADLGVTVLLASHLLHQVQSVCDRVGIFVDGRMVAQGAPAELARQVAGPVQLEVGARGAPDDIESALRRVPGVMTIERNGGHWTVTAAQDVSERLAAALAGAGLFHLRRRGGELDELYRRWFAPLQHEEAPDDRDG
jgi:ABC-2 type transport system ATP-binding protein